MGIDVLPPTRYTDCHHQKDCMKEGSCVKHFNISLTVWAKSQEVSINHNFFFFGRKRTAEEDRTEALLLTGIAPYR